ncbi:hypothetical protein [Leptodesmis sp.]|uniref:hypothetical protein n=1 Tax=Leptodesmis sp. TaxID=3100501 RepID=UPI0040535994
MKHFQTDEVDLFVDEMNRLVNVSRSGQLAMRETLKYLLTRVEWNVDILFIQDVQLKLFIGRLARFVSV